MATIWQDRWGHFWRYNGDGSATSMTTEETWDHDDVPAPYVVIIQDGQPTGRGDVLATRVALHMVTTGLW